MVPPPDPAGYIAVMRCNHLHPPFDNPAIRRAVLPAVVQADYMRAVAGDGENRWRDSVGFFCPGTPMASDTGMAAREADPDWATFRAESGKIGALAQQENKLITPVPWSPVQKAGQPFVRTLPGSTMVVDHRTYDFHPGKMAPWLAAYGETGLAIQKKHLGQFLFMGTTEVGPINQVVFMWAYESLATRAKQRGAMAADPAWGEFAKMTGGRGALTQQTNMIIKPTAFSAIK